jgi:serine/threonine-protein kinase RsbW
MRPRVELSNLARERRSPVTRPLIEPLDVPTTDDGLPMTRPPASYRPVRDWRLDSIDGLSSLRHELADVLGPREPEAEGSLAQTPEKVVLVASELATNALEHGHPPTIVQLARDGGTWLLDVADHDRGTTPVYAGERIPGAGGMGLHLARQLALDVGWYTTETTKNVWVTFPVD